MDPLQEFLSEYGQTKEASPVPSMRRRFGDALVSGGAAAGAAAVIGGAGVAASHVYDALTKGRDFRRMLEHNPDLKEHHDNDPKMFNQMYSSLRGMNADFARDPIVAGGFMRQMVNNPMGAGGILTQAQPGRPAPSAMRGALDIGANAGAAYFTESAKQLAKTHAQPEDPNADIRALHERSRMMGDMFSYTGPRYMDEAQQYHAQRQPKG